MAHRKEKNQLAELKGALRTQAESDVSLFIDVVAKEHRHYLAIEALAETRDPDTEQALIEALRDPRASKAVATALSDPNLRSAAQKIATRTSEMVKPLVADLTSAHFRSRQKSISSLQALGWEPSTADEKVRYCIATENLDELQAIGDTALPLLLQAFRDKKSDNRHFFVRAIQAISPTSFETLKAREFAGSKENAMIGGHVTDEGVSFRVLLLKTEDEIVDTVLDDVSQHPGVSLFIVSRSGRLPDLSIKTFAAFFPHIQVHSWEQSARDEDVNTGLSSALSAIEEDRSTTHLVWGPFSERLLYSTSLPDRLNTLVYRVDLAKSFTQDSLRIISTLKKNCLEGSSMTSVISAQDPLFSKDHRPLLGKLVHIKNKDRAFELVKFYFKTL
jgi:hypothetical protein